ncbi:MAG: glycosyltransferase family 4 protein [Candidatus Nanopelagicales bacterium]
MRIAHVSDCYAPRTGGIETQVGALAARQRAAGDDVRVLTATPGRAAFGGDDEVDGIIVHRVAAHLPFELPVHPRTAREVGRVLDAHPVDVVHVHAGVVSPFAWGAIRAARRRGVPTLVTVHSVWGSLARPGFAAADALVGWSRWGAALSAVSRVAADRIESALPRVGHVPVVPNGIDPAEWSVAAVDAEAGVLRVVSVLRMAPRKRVLPLVRMLRAAAADLGGSVRVEAVLIGDGPERARAQRVAQGTGGSVEFAGRLPRERILEVFARSDVFVQPSVKESFGLAALEARTAGLPVVARSQAGTTEFVHEGVEGLLADDDAGMARAIARLGRDRALLAALARHNRSVEPAQAWPGVLATVREAYARAGAGGH